jgi:hypothetical protein
MRTAGTAGRVGRRARNECQHCGISGNKSTRVPLVGGGRRCDRRMRCERDTNVNLRPTRTGNRRRQRANVNGVAAKHTCVSSREITQFPVPSGDWRRASSPVRSINGADSLRMPPRHNPPHAMPSLRPGTCWFHFSDADITSVELNLDRRRQASNFSPFSRPSASSAAVRSQN